MAVLDVKDLKKSFGNTDVLKGVSFSLEKGQVLAIIGSSGSGKTTLLRCLNFLETPDSGEIYVDGKSLLAGFKSRYKSSKAHILNLKAEWFIFPHPWKLSLRKVIPPVRSAKAGNWRK